MDRWDEYLKNHPIHTTLEKINHLLRRTRRYTNSRERSEKRRISKVINTLEEVFQNLDPDLVPHRILHQIHSIAEDVLNHLNIYRSTEEHDHLRSANDSLDHMLIHISHLLSITKRPEIAEHVKRLERSLDELTKDILDKKKLLENEILKISELSKFQREQTENLSKSVDARRQEANSLISRLQTQYFDEQSKRNNIFIEDQRKRTNAFTSWKSDFEKQTKTHIDQLITISSEKSTAEQKKFSDKISSLIKDAEDKHRRILELYGLVASDSVALDYSKNAENEKMRADIWNVATLVFILGAAGWFFLLYIMNSTDFSLERIITTSSITIILLFGAAYSSKQSSLHRENEKRARWVSLDVKAFDPFIESLPEKERNNLKKEISERLFGQQYKNTEKETPVRDEHIFKVIKDIVDIVKSKWRDP